MSLALAKYQPTHNIGKTTEMRAFLKDTHWDSDVWHIQDSFFDNFRGVISNESVRRIVFSEYPGLFKLEMKYYFAKRISENSMQIVTLYSDYQHTTGLFVRFLREFYPEVRSFSEVGGTINSQWLIYAQDEGRRTNRSAYKAHIYRMCLFFSDFYNYESEFEKDIWDCRKIPGITIPVNSTNYFVKFSDIPPVFRGLAKRYLKLRITMKSPVQTRQELIAITCFFKFIAEKEPAWSTLNALSRSHIEDFLAFYLGTYRNRTRGVLNKLIFIKHFLERIQQFGYAEAPLVPVLSLIYYEDIPAPVRETPMPERIKYIPEGVMLQLREHLEYLTPTEYIPIVVLLMASGWRASDVLNLRYDTCLEHTEQGWYLKGDIPKTRIKNHRIPITEEVKNAVESCATLAKAKSTDANNPLRLLFNRYSGKRMGRTPHNNLISGALNRLAKKYNITDDQGNIYHFKLHAFRHTKGVELINNGMSLIHVQKWMAHMSPEMTLVYAQVMDTTLRKSWEQAVKNGLFRVTDAGHIKKVDISSIENEDLIEWEYIRHNLDAVRMPLGFCMKPKKQNCFTQLNPCLTCRNLCTTPDFLPQFEVEILETKDLIERGKTQGREMWVEKNQHLLERYEEIAEVLKTGHTRHIAGKSGREYIGEERKTVE